MLSVPVEKTVTHYDTTIAGWCKYGFAGEMLRMWKQCSQFLGKAPKDGIFIYILGKSDYNGG